MPSNLDIQHSCFFRGLHRLAVHNPSARCGFSTGVLADLASKHVVDMLPGAIQPPRPKVVVDALPGRQVVGEHPPGDTASESLACQQSVDGLLAFLLVLRVPRWPIRYL